MKTGELSEWMLAEHERILGLASQLRGKITTPPPGDRAQWIDDLRSCFDEFVGHLHRHMAAEEDGGYLSQVVEMRPSLSEAVEIIRREHEELAIILQDLHTSMHELAPINNLLVRDCCNRIESFLTWLERHEEHENHIVMYAFTQDIEAQD